MDPEGEEEWEDVLPSWKLGGMWGSQRGWGIGWIQAGEKGKVWKLYRGGHMETPGWGGGGDQMDPDGDRRGRYGASMEGPEGGTHGAA